MSRLKISDLSFCETELHSHSKVQGGLSIFSISPLFYFPTNQQPTLTVSSGTSHTDFSKYLIKDQSGNTVGAGGTLISTSDDGIQHTSSVSSFSITGNLSLKPLS